MGFFTAGEEGVTVTMFKKLRAVHFLAVLIPGLGLLLQAQQCTREAGDIVRLVVETGEGAVHLGDHPPFPGPAPPQPGHIP